VRLFPKPLTLAWLAVPMVVGLGIWGWSVEPDRPGRWMLVACVPLALWAFAELMQGGDRTREREAILDWHRSCVAWIGLTLLLSIGPRLAIAVGLLDASWWPVIHRLWWLGLGASMAIWGNLLPTLLSPWEVQDEPFDWQGVHRFVGWVATLGGIAVVLAWLALTPEAARPASRAILGTVMVLALGKKLTSLMAPPSHPSPPAALRAGRTRKTPG
jgi:hypothetical protein